MTEDTPALKLTVDGQERHFDINAPKLHDWVEDNQFQAGDYPYQKKMKSGSFEPSRTK